MHIYFVLRLFLLFVTLTNAQNEEEIDYYVKLISETEKRAESYERPTNAYEFAGKGEYKNYGDFDFIVIGSGSAGSVVANRLSEIREWSVLVLEAGPHGNNQTDVPNLYGALDASNWNWGYRTTPQETFCLGMENHQCAVTRGRGLGGTTLLNGLVYARGHSSDYENWSKLVGSTRWNYSSVLYYFKKSENFVHNDPDAPYEPEYHGTGGNLRVEYHHPKSPHLLAFLEANKELGYKHVDYNANKLGVSQSQVNTINGRRLDGAKAFLDPINNRKNLKILLGSYVTRLRFDKKNKVVVGVEFTHRGKNYFVKVRKEVILSAGAFGSAQILMLSGVGPRKHLEELGIKVVADLEVGSALCDHPGFLGITVGTNYTEPVEPLREYVKEFLNGEGPYAIPNSNQGVGFYESSYTNGTGVPDIELEFIPANATGKLSQKNSRLTDQTYEDLWKNNNIPQSFTVYVVNVHGKSTGTFRLKSKNPFDHPLIDTRGLSDPENRDINILYEGVQLVLRLLETKAFKAMDAKLQGGPLRACGNHQYLSKEYWFCALRQLTYNFYHPVGSCPMGKNPKEGAVVDSKLRVFGIKNLRVADGSVIPFNMACHTNAPIVMVGEQLGDLVKETYNVL